MYPGELVSLLGANGQGKPTAVKLLRGWAAPNQGRIRVFGENPHSTQAKIRVGAMLQVAKGPETLKVREHIQLFSCYYPNPLPQRAVIETAGLQGLKNPHFGYLSVAQSHRALFSLPSFRH